MPAEGVATARLQSSAGCATITPIDGGVLRLLAISAAGGFAVWLGHTRAGISWGFSILYGAIAAAGVFLASRPAEDPEKQGEKITDLGRGLVVTILLALVANSISHSDAQHNARTALALTLSSGHDLTGIDLHERNLERFFIGGKILDGANLTNANLHEAVLRDSRFAEADFHGSDTDLSDADLTHADLRLADLRLVDLRNADLTDADLRDADLAGADLREAILSGADARGADFRDADLRGAQLLGTDLRESFLEADARGAMFSADLRDADIKGAAINELRTDGTTVWWPKFDLERAKADASAPPPKLVVVPKGAVEDTVVRVVDGDTIVLRDEPKLRLLGIDAPREVRPLQCYAHDSTAYLKRLLPPGTAVFYKTGVTGQDNWGRTLAYVWTRTGGFVDEEIVEGGAATFKPPPRTEGMELPDVEKFYVGRLRKAQVRAEMAGRGIWRACSATADPEED